MSRGEDSGSALSITFLAFSRSSLLVRIIPYAAARFGSSGYRSFSSSNHLSHSSVLSRFSRHSPTSPMIRYAFSLSQAKSSRIRRSKSRHSSKRMHSMSREPASRMNSSAEISLSEASATREKSGFSIPDPVRR